MSKQWAWDELPTGILHASTINKEVTIYHASHLVLLMFLDHYFIPYSIGFTEMAENRLALKLWYRVPI